MEAPVGDVSATPLEISCFVCISMLPSRVGQHLAQRLQDVLGVGEPLEVLYLCADCNLKLLQIEQLITELQKIYREKGANAITKSREGVTVVTNPSPNESIKNEQLAPAILATMVKAPGDASENDEDNVTFGDMGDNEAVSPTNQQRLDCGCGATFTNQHSLEVHRRDNHGGGVACRDCGLTLTEAAEIMKHSSAHSTDSFKCLMCGQSFDQMAGLQEHQRLSKSCVVCLQGVSDDLKCGCGAEFANVGDLRIHRETVHAGRFVCEVCKKTYHSNSHLLRHYQQMHARTTDKKPVPQRKSIRERKVSAAARRVADEKKTSDTQEKSLTARQRAVRKVREAALAGGRLDEHVDAYDEETEDDGPKPAEAVAAATENVTGVQLQDRRKPPVVVSTHEYLCPACDVTFPGHASWENHIQTYHWWRSGDSYQCALCSDMKSNLKEIAEHAQVHRNIMHACQQCPAMFPPERGYALRHRLVEHCTDRTTPKQNPFCEQCGQEMLSASDLAFHQLMLHDVNVPARMRRSKNPYTVHSCNYCQLSFTTDRHLIRHILDLHTQGSQLAQSEDYLLMDDEEEETSTTSGIMPEESVEEVMDAGNTAKASAKKFAPHVDVLSPPYTCTTCHRTCKSASTYAAHKDHFCVGTAVGATGEGASGKPSKKYLCSLCGTVLTTNSGFRQHMANHNNKNRFACDICDKTFAILSQVNFHRKQHTRTFVCQQCDKRFKTLSHLTDHQITHSSEMNFPCDMCEARFKWRPTLVRHKFRVHGHGEKPHHSGMRKMMCVLCNMRISSGTRTKHFKRRHKEIPYELKYFTLLSDTSKDSDQPPPQRGVNVGSDEVFPTPPQTQQLYVAPEPTVPLTLPSIEQGLAGAPLAQPAPPPELHASMISHHHQQFLASVSHITQSLPTSSGTAFLSKFPLQALPEPVVSGDPTKLPGAAPPDQVAFDVVNMHSLEGESHYQVVQDASGIPMIIQPTWQTVSTPHTGTLPS